MRKEFLEKETADILENNYQRYLELGGIINENDCQSALDRMNSAHALDRKDPQVIDSIRQVVDMARYVKIKLNDSEDVLDPMVVLYVILRLDTKPKDVKYHHSQMSDQRIFGEVLRMVGDADSFDKLVKAYPNISFKYERGE